MAKVAIETRTTPLQFRAVTADDLDALVELENRSFSNDRLSRRSFRNWINNDKCIFLIGERDGVILGYGLVLLQRGTRLARLYSIAVDMRARGMGFGEQLLLQLEQRARKAQRLFLRLEVDESNQAAISLYRKLGYKQFGEYEDYYDNHNNALRMQKCIRSIELADITPACPWYQQTTDFTCGPAALLMAMASQESSFTPSQELELDIWRIATTIFMTTGHGGCHPIGLALAASELGFDAEVIVNTEAPLFLDGVRSVAKKNVVTLVDQQFREKAAQKKIPVRIQPLDQQEIRAWMERGYTVIVLISVYRFEGRKAPHWVAVTGIDDVCMYVHDPDIGDYMQDTLDCHHIPIALEDFAKMASYGSSKMRTAVAVRKR